MCARAITIVVVLVCVGVCVELWCLLRVHLWLWHGSWLRLWALRALWSLYVLLDESRLSAERLLHVLEQVGQMGYGRDASSGLGKFTAEWLTPPPILSNTATPNAWLTLAPCAPQGGQWDAARSFYRPFTRYGRHGDMAAILGQPFKKPLLLAATGAVLSPLAEADWGRGWVGQGLGGGGEGGVLSDVLSKTVHQGYAPALAVALPVLH